MEKAQDTQRYHTELSESHNMSNNMSNNMSLFHLVMQKTQGNDINKLVMEKARILR